MKPTRGKTAFLILVFAGSTYYGVSKYREISPSPAINNGTSSEFGRRERGNDDERRQRFAQMANLTPEQQEQMNKIRESGLEGRDRWTSISAILTPEQRQRMDAARQERRDRGAKAALSKSDFQKYQQKRDQMRGQRGPRGNGGGPRGHGGGPRG